MRLPAPKVLAAVAGTAALAVLSPSVALAHQLTDRYLLMVVLTSVTLWSLGQAVLAPTSP